MASSEEVLVKVRKCALELLNDHILNDHVSICTLQSLNFLVIIHSAISQRIFWNTRSIFYSSVEIFKSQTAVSALVRKYTRILSCSEPEIFIRPGLKGFFIGTLYLYKNGEWCRATEKCLIPNMDDITSVAISQETESDPDVSTTILIVEKETIADRIAQDIKEANSPIIVCGKGYPCRNTIKFLRKLNNLRNTRFLCLTDFDPYGLHIFLMYKKELKTLRRVGLDADDLFEWKAECTQPIKLSKYDYKMMKCLQGTEMEEECKFIHGLEYKFELESVFGRDGFNLLEYLQKKNPGSTR